MKFIAVYFRPFKMEGVTENRLMIQPFYKLMEEELDRTLARGEIPPFLQQLAGESGQISVYFPPYLIQFKKLKRRQTK